MVFHKCEFLYDNSTDFSVKIVCDNNYTCMASLQYEFLYDNSTEFSVKIPCNKNYTYTCFLQNDFLHELRDVVFEHNVMHCCKTHI